MPFQKGQSGNPAGRRPMKQILRFLPATKAAKIKGLDLVASVADYKGAPLQMRLTAATVLAQYQELRPAERIGRDLGLPEPTNIETAAQNIAKLGAEAAADRLSADIASKLISHQEAYIEARAVASAEARLDALEAALERYSPQGEVEIVGGLPPLPGVEIIMPNPLLPPRRHHDRDRGDNEGGP
jgi:hypothetical protein